MRAAQLAALDETTRLLAQWLESRSSRFSKERFLLLAGVKPD